MRTPRMKLSLSAALACCGAAFALTPSFHAQPPAQGTPPPAEIRFNADIRPILSNKCFKCHGPDLKKGGLDLQTRPGALKELKSGERAVVPGKSAASALLHRITTAAKSERMPPTGEPLTPAQVAKLRAWIDQGAKYEEH